MNPISKKIINFVNSRRRISLFIIFIITSAAYSNIFQNEFVMDDMDYIVDWPLIQDWGNIYRFFVYFIPPDGQVGVYSPLKTVFHAVNWHLFGTSPFGYHIISLLIHFTGIFLVYRISMVLMNDSFVSFLAALFFAVHPVQTEAVTFMTASVDMIGILFLFTSFLFYAKAACAGTFIKKYYVLSLILSFLAIFSHELAISAPLLFLFYELCLNGGKEPLLIKLKRIFPFVLFVLLYVAAKYFVLGSVTRGGYIFDSCYLTMLVMLKTFFKYVLIVLFPLILTVNHAISEGIFAYDHEDFDRIAVLSQSFSDPQVLISVFILGLIAYCGWRSYGSNKNISFCIGWFFLCLFPVSNIIPSGVYFGERYLYPGMFGFCLLTAILINQLMKKAGSFLKISYSAAGMLIIAVLVLGYSARTYYRNFDWKDDMHIYEKIVWHNPRSAFMNRDLGITYLNSGYLDAGMRRLKAAVALKPDNSDILFSLAEGYRELQEFDRAKESLELSIQRDPKNAEAYFNLAGLHAYFEEKDKAMETLAKSIGLYKEGGRYIEAYENERVFKEYWGYE